MNLEGRAAIVTGAGDGLGRAEALALAAEGASGVLNDVSESAQSVVEEIETAQHRDGRALGLVCAHRRAVALPSQ